MRPLSDRQYSNFLAALRKEPHSRKLFADTEQHVRLGIGCSPDDSILSEQTLQKLNDLPRGIREWRKDREWALRFIAAYQHAAHAAWLEFWGDFHNHLEVAVL